MTRSPWYRLAVGALIALLVAVGLPPLANAAPGVSVAVTLTSLTVTGNKPTDRVEVTGTLVNDGAQAAFGVHLVLWRSQDPITDAEVLTSVASGTTVPWGARLYAKPTHFATITSSTESLDPGKGASFALSATLAELGFTEAASYSFGVQALGTPDASSNYSTIGRARTFVVIPGKKSAPLTEVVLLSSAPAKYAPNLFSDDHLAAELTGRLDRLLDAAASPGRSWLIDPALYDEIEDMADGYQVSTRGQLAEGTGQAAAAAWLGRFRELPTTNGGRTLFGNPDVLGAVRGGDEAIIGQAAAAGEAVTALKALPLVVVPKRGWADADLLAALKPIEPAAVLTTGASGPTRLSGTSAGVPVLNRVDLAAGGPGKEQGAVQRHERLLAEAFVNSGQVRLITTEEELRASEDASPRWLRPVGLGAVLGESARGTARLTVPAKLSLLSAARLRELDTLDGDFTGYAELVPESRLVGTRSSTVSRLASWQWPDAPTRRAFLAGIAELIGGSRLDEAVRLDASSRVVMSSRTNEFPVTVTNDLSEAIHVRVEVTSENPQRLTIPSSDPITVQPGQSVTVNLRSEASSSGLVTVRARLVTESGRRITPPRAITVDVTELGMIGWIIVISSGVVLFVASAWRIRQVRRRQPVEAS